MKSGRILQKKTQMWDAWKVLYKDAHAKAPINNSAIKGDQFGAANEADVGAPLGANKRDTTTHRAAAVEDEFDGGTTEMEGFFITLRRRLPTTRLYCPNWPTTTQNW